MEKLLVEDLEIGGEFDFDGECYFQMDNGSAYLNREQVQKVIDHLTKLLKL